MTTYNKLLVRPWTVDHYSFTLMVQQLLSWWPPLLFPPCVVFYLVSGGNDWQNVQMYSNIVCFSFKAISRFTCPAIPFQFINAIGRKQQKFLRNTKKMTVVSAGISLTCNAHTLAKAKKSLIISSSQLICINTQKDPTQEFINSPRAALDPPTPACLSSDT